MKILLFLIHVFLMANYVFIDSFFREFYNQIE